MFDCKNSFTLVLAQCSSVESYFLTNQEELCNIYDRSIMTRNKLEIKNLLCKITLDRIWFQGATLTYSYKTFKRNTKRVLSSNVYFALHNPLQRGP